MAAVLRTLVRAGLTSGSIMGLSDFVAQAIASAGFRRGEPYSLTRTVKYFWLGLTADGPFWETAFGVVERIFGAAEGAGGSVKWGVLAGKTAFTQLVINPIFLLVLISYTAVLEGPRTLESVRDNLRAKLPSYLQDGFIFWSLCNTFNYRFVAPGRRMLFSSVVGLCWSTYFSWITRKLDQQIQRGHATAAGQDQGVPQTKGPGGAGLPEPPSVARLPREAGVESPPPKEKAKLQSSGTAGVPQLYMHQPTTAAALSELPGSGTSWIGGAGETKLARVDVQHQPMGAAPAAAQALAERMHASLAGAWLPASESDTMGRVVVITGCGTGLSDNKAKQGML